MHLRDAVFGSSMITFLLMLLTSHSKEKGKFSGDIGELQFRCRRFDSFCASGGYGHAIPPVRALGQTAVPRRKTLLVDTRSTNHAWHQYRFTS